MKKHSNIQLWQWLRQVVHLVHTLAENISDGLVFILTPKRSLYVQTELNPIGGAREKALLPFESRQGQKAIELS